MVLLDSVKSKFYHKLSTVTIPSTTGIYKQVKTTGSLLGGKKHCAYWKNGGRNRLGQNIHNRDEHFDIISSKSDEIA
jgi:hypothetical protein